MTRPGWTRLRALQLQQLQLNGSKGHCNGSTQASIRSAARGAEVRARRRHRHRDHRHHAQRVFAGDQAGEYTDTGNVPGKDCDDCSQYVPGPTPKDAPTCKLVEGAISAHGHCIAFSPK
jgi:hypothetical protein